MFFLAALFTTAVFVAVDIAVRHSSEASYGEATRASFSSLNIGLGDASSKNDYLTIRGLGGCLEVGASGFLVQSPQFNILLDAGINMLSGAGPAIERFLPPDSIDAIVATHAHLDHVGYIPMLCAKGFSGPIIGTRATMEEAEAHWTNRFMPTPGDVDKALLLWTCVSPGTVLRVGPLTLRFMPAGHLLGAVMVELEYGDQRVLYTGDIGAESFLLAPYELLDSAQDLLLVESTYGGEVRNSITSQAIELLGIVSSTVTSGGSVIIPAFAAGRSQEILTVLLEARHFFPDVPIYVDGSIKTFNRIYSRYVLGEDILRDEGLDLVWGKWDRNEVVYECDYGVSKKGNPYQTIKEVDGKKVKKQGPRIIVTTSGMGFGPAEFYIQTLGDDSKNTLILVGYQAIGTPGWMLEKGEGDRELKLRVEKVGFSGHADAKELTRFIQAVSPKKALLIHGEGNNITQLCYQAQRLGIDTEPFFPLSRYTIFGDPGVEDKVFIPGLGHSLDLGGFEGWPNRSSCLPRVHPDMLGRTWESPDFYAPESLSPSPLYGARVSSFGTREDPLYKGSIRSTSHRERFSSLRELTNPNLDPWPAVLRGLADMPGFERMPSFEPDTPRRFDKIHHTEGRYLEISAHRRPHETRIWDDEHWGQVDLMQPHLDVVDVWKSSPIGEEFSVHHRFTPEGDLIDTRFGAEGSIKKGKGFPYISEFREDSLDGISPPGPLSSSSFSSLPAPGWDYRWGYGEPGYNY